MLITYTPQRVLFFLGLVAGGLVLANLVVVITRYVFYQGYVSGLFLLFYLGSEHNIPTFFSSLLLLLCSGLLGIIAYARKKLSKGDVLHWLGLAAVFLFLSLDESLVLHERLIRLVGEMVHASGFFFYAWVIPYGIGVIALALIYLRFLLRLPTSVRYLTIGAGVIYVSGALGFELLEGYYVEKYREKGLIFAWLVTCEETLELGGVLLFLYALMTYIDTELGNLYFHIASWPDQSQLSHFGDQSQRGMSVAMRRGSPEEKEGGGRREGSSLRGEVRTNHTDSRLGEQ